MARTYYNAGSAGREYSRLRVWRVYLDPFIGFSTGPECGVLLTRDQVRDLRDQLTAWLGDVPAPPPAPMMEGELGEL